MIDFSQMTTTREDLDLISAIANRAIDCGVTRTKMDLVMDIEAANAACPLDLVALSRADAGNMLHDVCGIVQHLDRNTGKLTDCFQPRYAKA